MSPTTTANNSEIMSTQRELRSGAGHFLTVNEDPQGVDDVRGLIFLGKRTPRSLLRADPRPKLNVSCLLTQAALHCCFVACFRSDGTFGLSQDHTSAITSHMADVVTDLPITSTLAGTFSVQTCSTSGSRLTKRTARRSKVKRGRRSKYPTAEARIEARKERDRERQRGKAKERRDANSVLLDTVAPSMSRICETMNELSSKRIWIVEKLQKLEMGQGKLDVPKSFRNMETSCEKILSKTEVAKKTMTTIRKGMEELYPQQQGARAELGGLNKSWANLISSQTCLKFYGAADRFHESLR
jgi:hypothetical protein